MQSVMLCDRLLCVWTVSGVSLQTVLNVTVFYTFLRSQYPKPSTLLQFHS